MIGATDSVKADRILWPHFHEDLNKVLVKLMVYSLDLFLYRLKILFLLAFLENEEIQNQNYQEGNTADQ